MQYAVFKTCFNTFRSDSTQLNPKFHPLKPIPLFEEVKLWSKVAFLSGIGWFSSLVPWFASIAFIGHTSTMNLAALSAIEVWVNSFMEILWAGVGMTETVFVSQAHGFGSIWAMRGWAYISYVFFMIGSLIIAILCVFIQPTLITFGFDSEMVKRGSIYAYCIIPVLFIEGVNLCVSNYLRACQIVGMTTVADICVGLFDIPFTYILIFGIDGLGGYVNPLAGTAIAWGIGAVISCSINVGTLYYFLGRELEFGEADDDDEDGETIIEEEVVLSQNISNTGYMNSNGAANSSSLRLLTSASSNGSTASYDSLSYHNSNLIITHQPIQFGDGMEGADTKSNDNNSANSDIEMTTSKKYQLSAIQLYRSKKERNRSYEYEHLPSLTPLERRNSYQQYENMSPRSSEQRNAYEFELAPENSQNNYNNHNGFHPLNNSSSDLLTLNQPTWKDISIFLSNIRNWHTYGKQVLPNLLSISAECASFTFLSFLAAQLGQIELAVHNACFAVLEVAFTFARGMAEGTSLRLAFHIGRGDIASAKQVIMVSTCINTLWSIGAASLGYTNRKELASLISNDELVQEMISLLSPTLWSSYFIYCVGVQALAVLEGQGRAKRQMMANLIGSFGVTVPLGIFSFYYTTLRLQGLWLALLMGFIIQICLSCYYLLKSDWIGIVQKARTRSMTDMIQPIVITSDSSSHELR